MCLQESPWGGGLGSRGLHCASSLAEHLNFLGCMSWDNEADFEFTEP